MIKIKIIFDRFRWIKALFSPFTPFKISWYIGKTQIGVPYFLPRKWDKDQYKPLTIGFSSCGLGWKTKWSQYDIRHEWDPVISFVFFGYQIAMTVYHKHHSHYWEAWVCYEYMTDKSKTKKERIAFCREHCPQTWTRLKNDGPNETTDYYELILKPKYLK